MKRLVKDQKTINEIKDRMISLVDYIVRDSDVSVVIDEINSCIDDGTPLDGYEIPSHESISGVDEILVFDDLLQWDEV